MRIAMIGQRGLPATYGGVERHVEELSARLAERGHEVVVFCRDNYGDNRRDEYRGVTLRHPPTISSKHLEAAIHSGVSTLLTLGRSFDIVHFHAVGPGLWSPISRWLSGAKVVQTIHGLDQDRAKWGSSARRVLRWGDWLSQRVPDGVIVVGRYLLEHYRRRKGVTVHIPNGVSVSTRGDDSILAQLGLRSQEYVLFVGRLIPEKAVDQLIRAFGRVETSHRLVIVGGSSFTDDYELELKQLAYLDDRVVLPGYVYGAELSALYAHAALYVQPSLLEGFPLTVLEAAGHGLPMVLSDIPAHLEVLEEPGPGGRVYPAGDETSLSRSISEGLRNVAGERSRARRRGAAIMQRYSWDAVTDETEALYACLLEGSRRSRIRPGGHGST